MSEVERWFREAERLGAGPTAKHPVLRLMSPLATVFTASAEPEIYRVVEPLFDDPDPWLRAVAKMVVSQVRQNFGESAETADGEMREALALFREVGERWGIGFALSALGDNAATRGDFAQAVTWQREAIALLREVGVREDLPQLEVKTASQLWLGGQHDEARRMLKQAHESAHEVGMQLVTASVEYGHATICLAQGALDEAREHIEYALALVENGTFAIQFQAVASSVRGLIEGETGDLAAARIFHTDAIRIAIESKDFPVVASSLTGIADLWLRCGDPVRAARLLGGAEAIRGCVDRAVPQVDRIHAETRAALGDAGFETAYRSGSTLTVANAIEASGLTG
jgi:tetratricopeptide (TPR) repeat protein